MDPNDLAVEFLCPICHVLPIDPVIVEDGFIYCRRCIENFINNETSELYSPMTGELIGTTLIYSDTVKQTIQELTACEELEDSILGGWATQRQSKSTGDRDPVINAKKKAEEGDVECMLRIGRWYLFGEQDGVECDAVTGYNWCKQAAEQDDMAGKAYQGYCLIRGLGVESSDQWGGYELLAEAASQELNVVGRDFAAYTLGSCYQNGVYEFKHDEKRAQRWLGKVSSEFNPPHNMFEFADDVEEEIGANDHEQMSGLSLLFPDGLPDNNGVRRNAAGGQPLEADLCSLPSLSSTAVTSTSKPSVQSETCRKCERCSKEMATTTDISIKLCMKCRTVGFN